MDSTLFEYFIKALKELNVNTDCNLNPNFDKLIMKF